MRLLMLGWFSMSYYYAYYFWYAQNLNRYMGY